MSEPDTAPDRQAMNALASYRDSAHETVGMPPLAWVAQTARRRTRRRQAVTGSAVGLVAAATALGIVTASGGPSGGPGPGATISPSSPSLAPTRTPGETSSPERTTGAPTTPAFDIRDVEWTRASIDLPDQAEPACPTGRIQLRGEVTTVGDRRFKLGDVKAYGDLDRDGRPEAVLYASCERGEYDSGDGSGQLLVVGERGDDLIGLGYAGPSGENYGEVRVTGGRLVATVEQRYGDGVQQRTYRWDGQRFVQIAGPTSFFR